MNIISKTVVYECSLMSMDWRLALTWGGNILVLTTCSWIADNLYSLKGKKDLSNLQLMASKSWSWLMKPSLGQIIGLFDLTSSMARAKGHFLVFMRYAKTKVALRLTWKNKEMTYKNALCRKVLPFIIHIFREMIN